MNRERRTESLRAIVTLSLTDESVYSDIHVEAKRKYGDINNLCEEHRLESSYARHTHTGKIKEEYLDITPLELSMIMDNGFNHFGGSSTISADGSFTVIIFTD